MPFFEANFPQNKSKDVPCRSCSDFKSWANEQRGIMDVKVDDTIVMKQVILLPLSKIVLYTFISINICSLGRDPK